MLRMLAPVLGLLAHVLGNAEAGGGGQAQNAGAWQAGKEGGVENSARCARHSVPS